MLSSRSEHATRSASLCSLSWQNRAGPSREKCITFKLKDHQLHCASFHPWGENKIFNSIVLGNMAAAKAETRGRLVVAGNLDLKDYKIGADLYRSLQDCDAIPHTSPRNPYGDSNYLPYAFDKAVAAGGKLHIVGMVSEVHNGHAAGNDPNSIVDQEVFQTPKCMLQKGPGTVFKDRDVSVDFDFLGGKESPLILLICGH